jgi:ribonuclease R
MNNDPSQNTPSVASPDSEKIIRFMRETAARPMSARALAAEMSVPEEQHATLEDSLSTLSQQGVLVQTRDGRYGAPEKMNLVVGRLSTHSDGYGFVIPSAPSEQPDLYIPGRKLGGAIHGDMVVARKERVRSSGKVEGRVIRLLERARQHVVGKFERSKHFGHVTPLNPRLTFDLYIPEAEFNGAEAGKIVHAEITKYPEGTRNPEGRIVEVLGDAGDPNIDVEIVIREHELRHEFPPEVIEEAAKIPDTVGSDDLEGRADRRDIPVITIDGESAQDFDDAVHVEKLPNGNYRLAVHIADVAAYVPVGSAIDQEALQRATSVYFPDRVIPMLPERLSNEICSLKPGVDRLVQSVIMEINPKGSTVNYEFEDAVIRSAHRTTYKEIAALIEGADSEVKERYAEITEQVGHMAELCNILRDYRGRRGSIDFDLPEPELVINLRGEVEDVVRSERNLAHRVIEEFMIRANEVVASHLTWEAVPALFRVHEGPDLEKVEQFRDFISGLGLHLGGGKDPQPEDFQRLVAALEGQPCERVITYLMLRSMKRAAYSAENNGHFGLASERYTHFTSPIRRYPDLIVHRLLRADRGSDRQAPFDLESLENQLGRIATESSEKERNAEDAERQYVDWKKVQFMADKVGSSFEGYITSVHAFGFFVELDAYFVEGLVHVSALADDFYRYDEKHHSLTGEASGRKLALGNRVRVQLVRVDRERRRLDFGLEEGPLEAPEIQGAATDAKTREGGSQRGRRPARKRRRRKKSSAAPAAGAEGKEKKKPAAKEEKKAAPRRDRRRRKSSSKSQADSSEEKEQVKDEGKQQASRKRRRRKKAAAPKDDGKTKSAAKKKSSDDKPSGRKRSSRQRKPAGQKQAKDAKQTSGDKRSSKKKKSSKPAAERSTKKRSKKGGDAGKSAKKSGTEKKKPAEKKEKRPKRVNPYITEL